MKVIALLAVNQNKIPNVLTKIKDLGKKNISKVHLVYGEYDIITEINAHNPEISSEILRTLKETDGVNLLKTYVVSDQLSDEAMEMSIPPEPQ
jgi:DNA-binding Lrp family transcriptional regulator